MAERTYTPEAALRRRVRQLERCLRAIQSALWLAGRDLAGRGADRIDNEAYRLVRDLHQRRGRANRITCAICHRACCAETAHLHSGQWIGDECCWDERLRASE